MLRGFSFHETGWDTEAGRRPHGQYTTVMVHHHITHWEHGGGTELSKVIRC
ncbi:hypothetical protein [[Mycobacterium] zoologicum]|uniref:hypothetical protein n=1 Tax=[Mycobacterium] zoologicum TaxID=2872311 RepID=UPI001CDA80CD|nr:hypothetical protein [Mycolicibacter sp. MYC101]MEB3062235.1 hypothetical protein [Mycolicibacter sp. MYC101]